jgi:hypothetical protein
MKVVWLTKLCLFWNYTNVGKNKYLLFKFRTQNGLKQDGCLIVIAFWICFTVWKLGEVQENQNGLKLNATNQLLFHANEVNLLGK